jgi:hypothetical protein
MDRDQVVAEVADLLEGLLRRASNIVDPLPEVIWNIGSPAVPTQQDEHPQVFWVAEEGAVLFLPFPSRFVPCVNALEGFIEGKTSGLTFSDRARGDIQDWSVDRLPGDFQASLRDILPALESFLQYETEMKAKARSLVQDILWTDQEQQESFWEDVIDRLEKLIAENQWSEGRLVSLPALVFEEINDLGGFLSGNIVLDYLSKSLDSYELMALPGSDFNILPAKGPERSKALLETLPSFAYYAFLNSSFIRTPLKVADAPTSFRDWAWGAGFDQVTYDEIDEYSPFPFIEAWLQTMADSGGYYNHYLSVLEAMFWVHFRDLLKGNCPDPEEYPLFYDILYEHASELYSRYLRHPNKKQVAFAQKRAEALRNLVRSLADLGNLTMIRLFGGKEGLARYFSASAKLLIDTAERRNLSDEESVYFFCRACASRAHSRRHCKHSAPSAETRNQERARNQDREAKKSSAWPA